MKPIIWFGVLVIASQLHAKEPAVFDPAADPATLAATFLKGDKLNVLSNIKRIAIVGYRVEFGIENSGKASSSGTTGFTSSKADIKLVGVSDATRQAIADALYDDFVAGLTAAGYEVIPYEVVKEEKTYKSMQARFHKTFDPVGTQLGKSVFVGAHDLPTYITNDDKHLGLGSAFGGGFTVQPQNIEPQIAKALDAAVIRATLDVQFADMTKSGGLFRSGSSVKTDAQLALVPGWSQYLIVTPKGRARIALKQTVPIESDAIAMRDITTTAEKTTEAIGNAVSGLLTGGSSKVRHYQADANDEKYGAVVGQYAKSYQAAALALMKPAS